MAEYFLHDDIIVPVDRANNFEENVAAFIAAGSFARFNPEFDSKLVLALKTPVSFTYKGYDVYQSTKKVCETTDPRNPKEVRRYVHLWRIPDREDLDLAEIMTRSADDKLYNAINAAVTREIQNFVLRVSWLKGQPLFRADGGNIFIRATRHFNSESFGRYLFKVGMLFPQLEQSGWRTLGHYQNITGPLNTVTEFWQTKDGTHELGSILHALEALPDTLADAYKHLHLAEVRESFVRTSYSPAAEMKP